MATHVEIGRLARGKMQSSADARLNRSTGVDSQKGKGAAIRAGVRLGPKMRRGSTGGKIGRK
jgi:hypothetical protein